MGARIICDTRQQRGKHQNIDEWFDAHGVPYEYRKVDAGDYVTDGSNVAVDTKQGLSEVAGNLGRDHARFARECDRAREAGYRLVILVECGAPYRSIDDAERWVNDVCRRCELRRLGHCDPLHGGGCRRFRSRPMPGQTLARIMRSMERDHACRFEFCDRRSTARRICELLGVEYERK